MFMKIFQNPGFKKLIFDHEKWKSEKPKRVLLFWPPTSTRSTVHKSPKSEISSANKYVLVKAINY
jgi:hypothetical protein